MAAGDAFGLVLLSGLGARRVVQQRELAWLGLGFGLGFGFGFGLGLGFGFGFELGLGLGFGFELGSEHDP